MGLLRTFISSWVTARSLENPAYPISQAIDELFEYFGAQPNASGQSVNAKSAQRVTAVKASLRIIAETAGSLELEVFKKLPPAPGRVPRELDPRHPINAILASPNPLQTGQMFRESMFKAHLLHGKSAARILRNGRTGTITALETLNPNGVTPFLNAAGELRFEVQDQRGVTLILVPEEILYVPLSVNCGTFDSDSPIGDGAQAIGIALAAEHMAAKFFGEGLAPPAALRVPWKLDDEKFDNLRAKWYRARKGKPWSPAILEKGMELEDGKSPYDKGQMIEARKFAVLEVARILGVPPHMIAEAEKGAPKSSVEEQSRELVRHVLRPMTTRHEGEFDRKLFVGIARGRWIVRHKYTELLKADTATVWQTYSVGRQMGIYSVNEVRADLGLPPIGPAGDVHMSPVNMEILKTVERQLEDELRRVGAGLIRAERKTLLEATSEGADGIADRAERFFGVDQRTRITDGIAEAGGRLGRLLEPIGFPVDLERFREFAGQVADRHCRRAMAAIEADPTDWIAGGDLEVNPAEGLAALLGRTNGRDS